MLIMVRNLRFQQRNLLRRIRKLQVTRRGWTSTLCLGSSSLCGGFPGGMRLHARILCGRHMGAGPSAVFGESAPALVVLRFRATCGGVEPQLQSLWVGGWAEQGGWRMPGWQNMSRLGGRRDAEGGRQVRGWDEAAGAMIIQLGRGWGLGW